MGPVLLGSACGRGPFYPSLVEGCRALDFLFVIDDSESMQAHQDNLRANFPGFIGGIDSTLADVTDVHVGVVTSDAYHYNAPGCHALGALVTSVDAGHGDEMTQCGPFAEGHRYMTKQDDLAESFDCTAAVGVNGNSEEKPMDAMRHAITPKGPWYDECNEDFIRDDALLVTVIITDEEDGEGYEGDPSIPSPDEWYQTVVDTKGVESNAVMVSLINGVTPDCPSNDPNFTATNIAGFTRRFTHGYIGGICRPDYGQLFQDAVDEIDAACSTYSIPYYDE